MHLIVHKTWTYRDRVRGVQELLAGRYAVPDQVTPDIAARCVDQGMGRIEVGTDPERAVTEETRKPKRGPKRRKGKAPENKIVHAPENKQALF